MLNTIDEKKITDRNLFFSENVTQISVSKLMQSIINFNMIDQKTEELYKLNGIVYNRQPINIYIDTFGGLVYSILGLISIIKKSKTPIYTYLTGCAMSCGFLLLISGHKRFSYEYSTALYHQLSSSSSGKIKEIEDNLIESQRLQLLIEKITLEKTKIPYSRLERSRREKEDWFIPSDELVSLGIVDEII